MPRNTKIVATLGPACSSPDVLSRMLAAGVDVVRLNFSHGVAADHVERARLVRECAQKLGTRSRRSWPTCRGRRSASGKFADGQGPAGARPGFRSRRRVRAGRRTARRPRLQGAAARRGPGRRAAARRRTDPAAGRVGRRTAHPHQGRDGRRALEQQGHQSHGRRAHGAGADREGHGRRQDGRDARGRLPRRVFSQEQGRHVHGARSSCAPPAATRC